MMVAGTRTVALQVVTNGKIPDSAGEGRGRGVGQDLLCESYLSVFHVTENPKNLKDE